MTTADTTGSNLTRTVKTQTLLDNKNQQVRDLSTVFSTKVNLATLGQWEPM